VFNAVSSGKAAQNNITVLVNQNPHCFDINIHSNSQFPRPLLLQLSPLLEVTSGDNWNYKACKSPVKLQPSSHQHCFYKPLDALPVIPPTMSMQ